MCTWGTTETVRIAAGWNGSGRPHRTLGYDIPVDACIADLVKALNDGGVVTRDSCCGHGRGPGMIRLRDGRRLVVEPSGASG